MQAVVFTVIGMSAVFLFLFLVMWSLIGVLWFVRRFSTDNQAAANEKAAALIGIALSRGMK